jgi:hypothetical protein
MSDEIPALQFEQVDFEPEKETWNVYELGDKSVIKIRTILFRLLRSVKPILQRPIMAIPPDAKALEFQAKFQNILAVMKATPTLMGKPTPPVPPEELLKLDKLEVSYTPYQEDWNVYRLPDGNRLKIKLVVSSVFRIKGRYDEMGYPMYVVNSTNAITPVPKP